MPRAASACSSSQKSRRAPGSTPAVGSSSSSSSGWCSMQAASARRCFQPPDSDPASCVARPPRPRPSIARSTACAALRHAVDAGDEVEVLADRQVFPEREALRHVADAALDLAALLADVVAEAGAGAGVRRQQPAHDADRGRLAAAVGAEEAEDLAALDLQRQVVDDVLVAEALVQPAHVDRPGAAAGALIAASPTPAARDAAAPRSPATGRASTRNTSLARVSLL